MISHSGKFRDCHSETISYKEYMKRERIFSGGKSIGGGSYYHFIKCRGCHSETITKQEYNAQVGGQTEFAFVLGGSSPIIVSLGDAIQNLYN